jgi:hypothetical protein
MEGSYWDVYKKDKHRRSWARVLSAIWFQSRHRKPEMSGYTGAIDDGMGHLVAKAFREAIPFSQGDIGEGEKEEV